MDLPLSALIVTDSRPLPAAGPLHKESYLDLPTRRYGYGLSTAP